MTKTLLCLIIDCHFEVLLASPIHAQYKRRGSERESSMQLAKHPLSTSSKEHEIEKLLGGNCQALPGDTGLSVEKTGTRFTPDLTQPTLRGSVRAGCPVKGASNLVDKGQSLPSDGGLNSSLQIHTQHLTDE